MGGGRVGMYNMSSAMDLLSAEAAREITAKVGALGPNPARPHRPG